MELTMTNSFGFCELNEMEMVDTNGGIAPIIPIVLIVAAAATLTGCTPQPYGTNSNGVDYNKGTYNQHKKIGCDKEPSICGQGKNCPFA